MVKKASSKGLQIGIESRLPYNPVLEKLGECYESIRRSALNDMQKGLTEKEIEKSYQSKFNLQWAWTDSIATEAGQTYNQLEQAKELNISRIKEQIRKKTQKANLILKSLLKIENPTQKQRNQFLGLKSKILKIEALKRDLIKLESSNKLHICFGSRKLFNAQHHLKENGYFSKEEWLEDWRKKRSGRFFCVGKSTLGGGTMIKVFHIKKDEFKAVITLPRFMQSDSGKQIEIPFQVTECKRRRKSSLLYALEKEKPITVQIFRREHKSDQWYIHLTTYVQEIPITTKRSYGCLGVDFNKNSVEWAYVLSDGNIKNKGKLDFKWNGFSSGQRQVMMRNLVVKLTDIAFAVQCPIAIESLDFSQKKASLSENSSAYNSMLSNLSTAIFRKALESRCKRYGIGLYKVNPAYTSVIGMIKFMPMYGLNSGTAAAMTIARRAIGYSERAPKCLVRPEDLPRHPWTTWNRVARVLKSNRVRRSELFDWMKTLGDILVSRDINEMSLSFSHASKQSNRSKRGFTEPRS
jgi:IS605 OrfB family transposase